MQNLPWRLVKWDNYKIWMAKVLGKSGGIEEERKDSDYISFLFRDCYDLIKKYQGSEFYHISLNDSIPKIIWTMWWQGIDSMPEIPKICLARFSCVEGYEVRIITKENITSFIEVGDILPYINFCSHNNRDLQIQSFSDLVRARLLYKFGGWWLDSTVFLANKKIFSMVNDNNIDFFSIHYRYRNMTEIHHGKWLYFCLATKPHNPLFGFLDEALTYQMLKYRKLLDYNLVDYLISTCYHYIPQIKYSIDSIPFTNPYVFWLVDNLNLEYNDRQFKSILTHTSVFKLDWRKSVKNDVDTYWNVLKNESLN